MSWPPFWYSDVLDWKSTTLRSLNMQMLSLYKPFLPLRNQSCELLYFTHRVAVYCTTCSSVTNKFNTATNTCALGSSVGLPVMGVFMKECIILQKALCCLLPKFLLCHWRFTVDHIKMAAAWRVSIVYHKRWTMFNRPFFFLANGAMLLFWLFCSSSGSCISFKEKHLPDIFTRV